MMMMQQGIMQRVLVPAQVNGQTALVPAQVSGTSTDIPPTINRINAAPIQTAPISTGSSTNSNPTSITSDADKAKAANSMSYLAMVPNVGMLGVPQMLNQFAVICPVCKMMFPTMGVQNVEMK